MELYFVVNDKASSEIVCYPLGGDEDSRRPEKQTIYKLNDAKICNWSLDDQKKTLTLVDSKNNVIELDTSRESSG